MNPRSPRLPERPAWQAPRAALCVATALACAGCASAPAIQPDGTLVRHYLGYVKVVVPQAMDGRGNQPVHTSETTVLGLRVGDGMGLGYVRDRQVHVPLDCRLVVLVANQAQLDQAVARLSVLDGLPGACAAVDLSLSKEEPR